MMEEKGCDYAGAWVRIHSRNEIRESPPVVDVRYADGTCERINVDEKYLKMLEDKWDATINLKSTKIYNFLTKYIFD